MTVVQLIQALEKAPNKDVPVVFEDMTGGILPIHSVQIGIHKVIIVEDV